MKLKAGSKVTIDIVYSPDDGGWYADISDPNTGRTLEESPLKNSETEIREWIDTHNWDVQAVNVFAGGTF